jgi:hypothetical protein
MIEIHGDVLPLMAGQTTASRIRFMSDILIACGQWSIPQICLLPQLKLLASLVAGGDGVAVSAHAYHDGLRYPLPSPGEV